MTISTPKKRPLRTLRGLNNPLSVLSGYSFLLPILLITLVTLGCRYIVVPADLMATPTSLATKGWTGFVTGISQTSSGDLHIDLAILNETQDWSAMSADEGKPATLTARDGKKTDCATVFAGTGGHRLAPGFQMRGYTAGTKKNPKTQLLYVECQGVQQAPGMKLSIPYSYVTGAYDLNIPSVPTSSKLYFDLDDVAPDMSYPVAAPSTIPIAKAGEKISAINNFTLILTGVKRTTTGLELSWKDENPSEYANYVHIGIPPVIGADGVIYGLYEDPSIADATIALAKATAEWTTAVVVPKNVTGLYVLVSVETRQSKYFVSHVIDIRDQYRWFGRRSAPPELYLFPSNFSAAELMQYRSPVVSRGPSSNTCPRCAPHRLHTTSTRAIPRLLSRCSSTFPVWITSQKLGHPDPESNLVSDENSACPQATHS